MWIKGICLSLHVITIYYHHSLENYSIETVKIITTPRGLKRTTKNQIKDIEAALHLKRNNRVLSKTPFVDMLFIFK